MEVPSTDAAASVVYLRHKRYHPLYTLQTQGRMHVQMEVLSARAGDGEVVRRFCASFAGAYSGSARDHGTAGQWPDRAADPAGFPTPQVARGQGSYQGRRRIHDPGFGIQDQPDGTGAGQLQG